MTPLTTQERHEITTELDQLRARRERILATPPWGSRLESATHRQVESLKLLAREIARLEALERLP